MSRRRRTGPGAPARVRDAYVGRPFAGLHDEPEWIALRELVPAASAPLRLAPELVEQYGARRVRLATILPYAAPAVTTADGHIVIGLQRTQHSGDVSRDLATALLAALQTPPGAPVTAPALAVSGPRLSDVLDDGELDITLHDGFDFWAELAGGDDPELAASIQSANASIYPTKRLGAVRAAYWCRVTSRTHLRWVLPDDEHEALDALARLAAQDGLRVLEGSRFAGMFRAHGRLVPVWDLPLQAEAEQVEPGLAELVGRYAAALSSAEPLDAAQRRARAGLLARQVTLR